MAGRGFECFTPVPRHVGGMSHEAEQAPDRHQEHLVVIDQQDLQSPRVPPVHAPNGIPHGRRLPHGVSRSGELRLTPPGDFARGSQSLCPTSRWDFGKLARPALGSPCSLASPHPV